MTTIQKLLEQPVARRIARTFLQGAIGGATVAAGVTGLDVSALNSVVPHLAETAWWKAVVFAAVGGGVGSVLHNYLPGLKAILPVRPTVATGTLAASPLHVAIESVPGVSAETPSAVSAKVTTQQPPAAS